MTEEESAAELGTTLGLVANDIRLDILRTLWMLYTDDPTPEPAPIAFSTLQDRVGVKDSGQFNYHLDKLVPEFVAQHDAGYTLTYAGARIVAAEASGAYTGPATTLDVDAIEECSNCEGHLDVRYEEGQTIVACDTCEVTHAMSTPPILIEAHQVREDPDLLGRFTLRQIRQSIHGFCHLCNGPVEGRVAESSLEDSASSNGNVKLFYQCTECQAPTYTTATMAVLDHPAVVSLLHDAGIDYRSLTSWGVPRVLESEERVRDNDPVRVEVTLRVGGSELTLVLDESLEVTEYRTSDRS